MIKAARVTQNVDFWSPWRNTKLTFRDRDQVCGTAGSQGYPTMPVRRYVSIACSSCVTIRFFVGLQIRGQGFRANPYGGDSISRSSICKGYERPRGFEAGHEILGSARGQAPQLLCEVDMRYAQHQGEPKCERTWQCCNIHNVMDCRASRYDEVVSIGADTSGRSRFGVSNPSMWRQSKNS
jgi:hypothetical protein